MLLYDNVCDSLKSFANANSLLLESSELKREKDTLKLVAVYSEISDGLDRIQRKYLELAPKYGLPTNALYEKLVTETDTYTLAGWEQKNRRYPILIRNTSNTVFKLHPKQFQELYDNSFKQLIDY